MKAKIVLLTTLFLFLVSEIALSSVVVFVDKGSYMLYVLKEGEVVLEQRVVIGRKSRPTPAMSDEITHIVINPTWTVPQKLARLDVVPHIQRDPEYIKRKGFLFFETFRKKNLVKPEDIKWGEYTKQTRFPYTIMQPPGPQNPLGGIKFILTNKRAIFLHGTPSRTHFDYENREISSGCVRVENEHELAQFLLPHINLKTLLSTKKEEKWIKLKNPVPVIIR